jgi:hypothetical protein
MPTKTKRTTKTAKKTKRTAKTAKSKSKVVVTETVRPAGRSTRSATASAMSSGLAALTEAGSRSTAQVKTTTASKPKSGKEPSLVFEAPAVQKHTRADAEEAIRDLRSIVAKMYGDGKFKNSAALMVPLTHIDNATYYKSCGCYDRSIDICNRCREDIL